MDNTSKVKRDSLGRQIIAENVPLLFNATVVEEKNESE